VDFFTQQLLNYFFNQGDQSSSLDDLRFMLAAQQGSYPFPLPGSWGYKERNWRMQNGNMSPEYKPGAEDRTVGSEDFYRLKIPSYKANPQLGGDKMGISQNQLNELFNLFLRNQNYLRGI